MSAAVVTPLAALTWDPQLRGFAILLVAFLILPGSVYLLLATNLGAKVGFLLALAGLAGWMAVMGVIWMVYGIGMKGREPSWKVREVVTGEAGASGAALEIMDGFPDTKAGWRKLEAGDAVLGDSQAAADKALAPSDEPVVEGEAPEPPPEFPHPFEATAEYIQVAGYDVGGDTYPSWFFNIRHEPHWSVIQVQPVKDPKALVPEVDPSGPVTTVVMVRDLGSVRFPPFALATSSLIIFGITCNALHRRDKEIMARRSGLALREAPTTP